MIRRKFAVYYKLEPVPAPLPMLTLRFFLIAAFSAILALGGCTVSDSSKEKSEAAAKKRSENSENRRAAAESIVNALARKSGANVDWKKQLGSTDFFELNRVYTVDVERVWIDKGPIVFLGALEDVAPHDQKNYHLFIRDQDVFYPEVRLHLTCPKEVVDPLLAVVKKDKESTYAGGIAVTARIEKVEHEMFFDGEKTDHIFVGHGQCIDLAYIGDALMRY